MIPKIIHYCWFGKNPIPKEVQSCMDSWRKYCPDYEIVEWNESNYNITKNKYMYYAYREKKWSFVSDYARVDIICHNGGIYLDTDVELIKSLDSLLGDIMFCGFEGRDPLLDRKHIDYENSVAFGLGFGAEKNHPILKDILNLYEDLSFYKDDGSMNLMACPHYQTEILLKYGLKPDRTCQQLLDCVVYPPEWFSPKSFVTGKINCTVNTVSIHHFHMSWVDEKDRNYKESEWRLSQKYGYTAAKIIVGLQKVPQKLHKKLELITSNNS